MACIFRPDYNVYNVLYLINDNRIDIKIANQTGENPLHVACKECNIGAIRALLSKCHDMINVMDSYNKTPIMYIVTSVSKFDNENRGYAVRILLDAGAKVNFDCKDTSILHELCENYGNHIANKSMIITLFCHINIDVNVL
jgi:ankyrin repeat protein